MTFIKGISPYKISKLKCETDSECGCECKIFHMTADMNEAPSTAVSNQWMGMGDPHPYFFW